MLGAIASADGFISDGWTDLLPKNSDHLRILKKLMPAQWEHTAIRDCRALNRENAATLGDLLVCVGIRSATRFQQRTGN